MSAELAVTIDTNPFATRWVRPGAIAYRFAAHESPETLIQRLNVNGGWGEIIGPHGSGKSTLLAALAPALEQQGRQIVKWELHSGKRRGPTSLRAIAADERTTMIVDGYEQLSRWQQWRLKRYLRARRAGLVITAHESHGLPTLWQTAPSLAMAQELARDLVAAHGGLITPEDVAAFYDRHHGNLRELFFGLYDLHEQRRQQPAATSHG